MKRALFLASMMATSGWAAVTYTFSSSNYSTITNFTSCSVGPCASYTSAMHISGSFTLAAALPPNFSGATDISSQIIAYSFSDGITTYANTDPKARIYQWSLVTDGSGNITIGGILIELWQTGTSPHAVGDRFTLINLNGPSINQAENNLRCSTVGGGTASGVTDLCVLGASDASTSIASSTSGSFSGGTPAVPPPATPAPPSLLLMLAGLTGCGLYLLARRRQAY